MSDFIERIKINDRRAFGQMVMKWSTGEVPLPRSLEEAEEQLSGIIEFPLPDYITGLSFVTTTKETWTIKIPPADMLQDTRNRINAGLDYVVEEPYREFFPPPTETDRKHALFEFRVGDYTCSLCA